MRSLLFRLSVALFAFVLGVLTVTAFAGLFGLGPARERVTRVDYVPHKRKHGCGSERLRGLPVPPQQTRRVVGGAVHLVGPQGEAVESTTDVIIERR